MDYKTYRKNYFIDPAPKPQFEFEGQHGASLYYEDYPKALAYYTELLGPPAYVEGDNTRGWELGNTWLTLFPAEKDSPKNAELTLVMKTPAEVDRLHAAFILAGGEGPQPSDELIYRPVRMGFVTDPFGAGFLIIANL
ncbi:MAG: hypothetical protein N2D54_05860 [Chloroflexota bacterium]